MSTVDLFAVQPYMRLADYATANAFDHKVDIIMQKIAARRDPQIPALVVFPEDLATFLVLSENLDLIKDVDTMDDAFSRIGRRLWPDLFKQMLLHRTLSLRQAFFLLNAPKVWRDWYRTMTRMARHYRVYLVAGSALLPENANGYQSETWTCHTNHIFNFSMTINPAGDVIHTTRKVNLVPTQEDTLDLSPGPLDEALGSFSIDNILCATAICYDGFRIPHTLKEPGFISLLPLMDEQGVRIIAQPSANPWWWKEPWPFNPRLTRKEQWIEEGAFSLLAHLTNISAIVNPQLLFHALDIHFDGPSTIYGRSGSEATILAQSPFSEPLPSSEDIVWFRWSD
jgi:predicted amidohydrolase